MEMHALKADNERLSRLVSSMDFPLDVMLSLSVNGVRQGLFTHLSVFMSNRIISDPIESIHLHLVIYITIVVGHSMRH